MTRNQKVTAILAALALSAGMTWTGYAEDSDPNFIFIGGNSYNTNKTIGEGVYEGGKGHSAAYVSGNLTLTANGATFKNGEVAVDNGGTLILNNGTIDESVKDQFTTEGGTITTTGTDTDITSGIWASHNYNQGGVFQMTGGSLSGNNLVAQGAGSEVSVTNGTVNVTNMIARNTILLDGEWKTPTDGGGKISFTNTTANADTLTLTKSAMTLNKNSELTIKGDANLVEYSRLDVKDESKVNVNGKANVSEDSTVTVNGATLTFASGSELHIQSNASGISTFAAAAQPLYATNGGKIVFAAGSKAYTTADTTNNNTIGTVASADKGGTIEVDSNAALYVLNAQADGQTTYDASKIIVQDGNGTQWGGKIFADNQRSTYDSTTKTFSQSSNFADTYAGLFAADAIQAAYDEGKGAGHDFVDAVEKANQTSDAKADNANIANAFNSAAGLTSLAGVGYGMYSFTNVFNDTIRTHKAGTDSLWASYLHDKRTADGLKVGNLAANYDLSYNGFVLGSDFYDNGKVQIGAAFAYANGDVSTNGGLVSTKNDVDYYGGTVYGTMDGGHGLTYKAELGYGKSSNDLTQYNSGKKITGSADAAAFHVGVSAEKEIKTGAGTWTPFAGLYFIDLGVDDYTDSLGFKHDSDNASVWALPIGVSYRHEVTSGDWNYTPVVTLGYRFAFGDKALDETYSYNGVGDTFSSDIGESVFFGRIGVEAAKDNVSVGLHYGYEKGSDTKSNQFGVNLAYHF